MRYLSPLVWRRVLAGYGLAGLVVGLLNRFLTVVISKNGGHPGWVTAVDVNLILPALAVCMGGYYPRRRVAIVGGLLLGMGFFLGMNLAAVPAFWTWRTYNMVMGVSPILVVGTLGYAIIGAVVATAAGRWRVVGLPDAADRCRGCGYLLTGTVSGPCPECGQNSDRG